MRMNFQKLIGKYKSFNILRISRTENKEKITQNETNNYHIKPIACRS